MGSRKRSPDDSAEHQAKRMKRVLHISPESSKYNQSDEDSKEAPVFGPWSSYVTSDQATRNIMVVLRFPSEERHCLELNDSCKLTVIFAFLQNHGLDPKNYTLRMLYPKRDFDLQLASSTLGELGFFPQELIHVNQRVL